MYKAFFFFPCECLSGTNCLLKISKKKEGDKRINGGVGGLNFALMCCVLCGSFCVVGLDAELSRCSPC